MLAQAQALGRKLAALEVYEQVLAARVSHGEADLDNSVIIEEVRHGRRER
jgi:hypothetical protein